MRGRKGTRPSLHTGLLIEREGLEVFRATLPEYRRRETYRFLATEWDIVRALYLLKQRPRDPQSIDIALFASAYGFPFFPDGIQDDTLPISSGFFYVDSSTVMSDQVDLTRPLTIARVAMEGRERSGVVLIDGLHRLCKAARLGISTLSAFVLTPEEEQLCRA